jgi:hypothetical protein
MKKLLSLLGAIGLVATSSATVVSCGTDPAETDTAIKAGDIQTTIGDNIKDLKDIDAVNTELAKYAKDGEKVIAGVETLVAALADGSKTDVVVTITPLTGYTIDGDATFTITGAIKSGETDKAIKAEDIQTTIGDHIKDLKDIDAVNTELAKYAKGGENAIDGVETLKAELADKSETDVVVTITPSTDYTIDGDATFTIAGAIQAPSL